MRFAAFGGRERSVPDTNGSELAERVTRLEAGYATVCEEAVRVIGRFNDQAEGLLRRLEPVVARLERWVA
jgi:hypothetical protein